VVITKGLMNGKLADKILIFTILTLLKSMYVGWGISLFTTVAPLYLCRILLISANSSKFKNLESIIIAVSI